MRLKNDTIVTALKDLHKTGYAGFGYGGDNLYIVSEPVGNFAVHYAVRSDSWEEAYETALECLAESFETFASADEIAEMLTLTTSADVEAFMAKHYLSFSPSGRLISSDNEIRVDSYESFVKTFS
jgi:hypothetical protein